MVKRVVLQCARLADREGAHACLAEALALPSYYGKNLDALYDCLTEAGPLTLVLEGAEALRHQGGYGARVLAAIEDAARDAPDLTLVYGDAGAALPLPGGREMRRKDRAVTDRETIRSVIDGCICCRVGFQDGDEVYIVPLSFGWAWEDDRLVLYFHGAKAGRKYDLIRPAPRVGFEMDTAYALLRADTACGHSARFQSVIGSGIIAEVPDPEEKRRGLLRVMEHTAGGSGWDFPPARLEAVGVFRLTVDALSCKEHE